jgi:hypothetical protein
MGHEIDGEGVGDGGAIGDQVVEAVLAGVVLQLVDDGKAAVVEEEDDQLFLCENRGIDVGVHQEIAAVTDEDDGITVGFRLGLCDARAPAAGDLIAHAGKAKLDIDRADAEGAPVGGDLGRQAACGGDDTVARVAQRVHHADGLSVGVGAVAGGRVGGDVGIPGGVRFAPLPPSRRGRGGWQGGGERLKPQLRIAHDGKREVFGGIVPPCVQADEAGVGAKTVHEPVVKSCSRVPTARTTSAAPAMVLALSDPVTPRGPMFSGWVASRLARPRDGFHDGDIVRLGEGGQIGDGARILHAAACHDDRAFGRAQEGRGIGDLSHVGGLAADAVDAAGEEGGGVVIGPALQILRQANEGGAAIGGVEHGGEGCGQGLQDLRGVGDAVPVAADRLEGVVHPASGC